MKSPINTEDAIKRSLRQQKVFGNVSVGAAGAAFALMFAFGPMWGLLPVFLFGVFAVLY